jgi:2,4-dichlorophenol 6-monooxygenase
LAAALGGLKVYSISQFNWVANTPRAHITNQRAMEVFRDLWILDAVKQRATPWELMGDQTFCTSFAGDEVMRAHWWGTGEQRKGDYLKASPCGLVDLIQSELEPILVERASRAGATCAFSTEFQRFEQDESGVTSYLLDRVTGHEFSVRSRYLIGADGARSKVFAQLDLPLEGHMARGAHVYVQFKADLTRYAQHRPSILNYVLTDDASFGEIGFGLIRVTKPWTEWIAGWGIDTSNGEPDLNQGLLLAQVRKLIGDDEVEIEFKGSSIWHVNEAIAPNYSKGRVFCGGDAVHRHPPSSGLGLNTCVQDAHNLAWKLAYVIKGYAGEALLNSYTQERAPIGKQIVKRANQSRRDYSALHAVFRIPSEEKPTAAGIARLRAPGPEGVAARKALQAALDLKQTEFNGEGVEMNQRYVSDAIIPDASVPPEVFAHDREIYFQPSTRPGAKIPHVWLVDHNGLKLSTLDITGKGQFSVVTGLAGTSWAEAAQRLSHPFCRTIIVGSADAKDLYCEWQRIREIDEDGVLLVRPDGVIAWRRKTGVPNADTAFRLLQGALDVVLAMRA